MDQGGIQLALKEIEQDTDPTSKNLRLASLATALFGERGVDLVVVGGSAIEFYTDGAYTSGDVDLCVYAAKEPVSIRMRQEVGGLLFGKGGPRSWEVAGCFLDILGPLEILARTSIRTMGGPYGNVKLMPPEELIVERALVAVYPQPYEPARACAQKLIAAGLNNEIEVDWEEVRRLAGLKEYKNFADVRILVNEIAEIIDQRSPYDSHE